MKFKRFSCSLHKSAPKNQFDVIKLLTIIKQCWFIDHHVSRIMCHAAISVFYSHNFIIWIT